MKRTILILALLASVTASAQQMRDSVYTADSTASDVTVSIQLNARQAAGLYRIFGADWRKEVRSTITAYVRDRDPHREYKDQWDALQSTSLTAAQKRAVATALGIPDPRMVQVLRSVSVPVLGGTP